MSSNRSFGIVFFIVFLLISLYPLLKEGNILIWSLIISLVFLILGLAKSKILFPFNRLWFKFGLFLGKLIGPIIMGIVYFAVVFPTFLLLKLFKRNYLNIKYEKNKSSYWVNVKDKQNTMRDQF
jgi:predicted membrane protein